MNDTKTNEDLILIIDEILDLINGKKLKLDEKLSIFCAIYANECVFHGVKLDEAIEKLTVIYKGSKAINHKPYKH